MHELRQSALAILAVSGPQDKAAQVLELFEGFQAGKISIEPSAKYDISNLDIPGKPLKPTLVPPLQVPKRSMANNQGRASLLHSLAHIEFNAINLALDAVWRFQNMPTSYYEDWLKVSKEEAYHFGLVETYLKSLGYSYGDFPAHNSLWEMVERTSNDVLARMALVPRTMEARGLDAVPQIRNRFQQVKDFQAVEILEIILRDEIGHVAIGNKWFNYLCSQKGLSPITTYRELARAYRAPVLKGPFNLEGRAEAGFTKEELSLLGVD